ncbi:winged helix-turn-helix domain-containing protein [Pararhizobium haloflavum]|uniref:winged helix-turn-helix domain-containing protein n=1 Tax=Pararhizobium haloflavum TaxID=2037914 RepID=UPI0018E40B4C|nr:winged helix-turn-helix domain-containing protein [Pararhizobium haloflavum]
MDMHRFGCIHFDPSMRRALRDDGMELAFTRHERALLVKFTSARHRLLSRGQLLEALPSHDLGTSDRTIDFLVNRLRRKLGDNARAPRFIATQYGEGYVWIADPPRQAAAPTPILSTLTTLGSEEAPLLEWLHATLSEAPTDAPMPCGIDDRRIFAARFLLELHLDQHTPIARMTKGGARALQTSAQAPSRKWSIRISRI